MDLVSWGIGIPTGVGVSLLSQWLYHRWVRKRQAKGAYLTVSYSSGGIDFEGRAETGNLSTAYLYGDVKYQISVKMETGKAKKEVKIPPYRKML